MYSIDPDVQRQLVFQITNKDQKYFHKFGNNLYVDMLSTLMKNDMIPSMVQLEKDTLIDMVTELPDDLMSIVAAQVDTKDFSKFLIEGHMEFLQKAWMT